MNPDISVQIVNYKTKSFLNPLIHSIYKNTDPDLNIEINILDNNSGDDLKDVQAKWQAKNVNVYYSDKNAGFGAGHNLLASKTKAKHILILNPDLIFIEKNTIERLKDVAERTNAVVVGPRLLTPKSRTDMTLDNLSLNDLKQQRWDHLTRSVGLYRRHNKLLEVAWVSGAVFLVQHQPFMEFGGFDEKFFLYQEEVDLCRRFRKSGLRIIYDPSVQVLHYGGAVATQFSKYGIKSFMYFCWKVIKNP